MTNNGKAQVSAPQCTSFSDFAMNAGDSSATKVHSTGDAVLTAAIPAEHTGNITISQRNGFIDGTYILAPGTSKEEEVTASSVTPEVGAGPLAVTLTATKSAHAIGTRVVRKNGALRPGSVKLSINNAAGVAIDADGDGAVNESGVQDGTTGTIDYALGAVTITTSTAVTDTQPVEIEGDKMADSPDELSSGKNFFKNFARMSNGRADLPTGAVISNLGSDEIGVFVETAKSRSAVQFEGTPSASAKLGGYGSKIVTFQSGLPAEMRIRAGRSSTATDTVSSATERIDDKGVIDVAFFSVTNANGGSN